MQTESIQSSGWFTGTMKDVGWSLRRLRRSPSFTLVASLTLALGIGATTAIFSVVYGVLLKPLPFPDADRVVGLFHVWEGERSSFAPPNFLDVQTRAKSFVSSAAFDTSGVTLTGAGDPVRIIAAEVTAGFFDVLQTPPLLGRTLTRADNVSGQTDVVVLSHTLWASRFGSDRDIVGKRVIIDSKPRTVVGVMPQSLRWPFEAECWLPAEYTPGFTTTSRGAWYLSAFARLAPGISLQQAADEMTSVARQLEAEYPNMNSRLGMTAYPIIDEMLGDTKRALLVLLGAVGFVLLITCVNVANLVLARAMSRENEMSVRVALGAGRWRLVRQVMVESLMLALVGGLAGVALAAGGLAALQAVRPPGIPRLDSIRLDPVVLAFSLAVTMLTGCLFGLVPAWQTFARSLADVLRERGRSAVGPRGHIVRYGLIVGELTLAVMLLTGAGLLIRSFAHLLKVNPGFEMGEAATFRIDLPDGKYSTDPAVIDLYDRMSVELAALPGVTGVGAVSMLPPSGSSFNLSFNVTGRPPLPPNDEPSLEIRIADDTYFKTIGIPLRRGRFFTPEDRQGSTPVVIITEGAVRLHFPNEDPLGKHIVIGWGRKGQQVQGDVVGVIADVKSFGLDREAPPQLYLPRRQIPAASMSYVVRTGVQAATVFPGIRDVVRRIDPNLPVVRLQTLEAHVNATMLERRFYMLLLTLFASVALVLAGIGIFGVLQCLVEQRTREIGIRMALGANRATVMTMVLRQVLAVSAVGIALGTAGGLSLTGLMSTMLFQLSPTDKTTFAVVDLGLLFVAIIAAWIPTRRATRIDPTVALRAE